VAIRPRGRPARGSRAALVSLAVGFCSIALAATRADALPIVFDLRGAEGLAIDNALSGVSITVGGLTATFTHNDPGAGRFNQTLSAFGLNAAASGDVTDQLDSSWRRRSSPDSGDTPLQGGSSSGEIG